MEIKKHKTETPGYYFTYINRQHPNFKDQTEKIAQLFRESDGEIISELNTAEDKVNGIDKFSHKEVIGWFDSILNPSKNNLSGVHLIMQERFRQVSQEKYNKQHDVKHVNGELANAGALYAMTSDQIDFMNHHWGNDMYLTLWPFDLESLKFTPENRIKQLTKAGALIAAEIDRLQSLNS